MRITGSQVGPVTPAQLKKINKATSSASTEPTRAKDQVVFSSDVSAIEAARKTISESADIRQDKVEELRRQIQDGTYQVNADKVAEKIMAEGRFAKLGQK